MMIKGQKINDRYQIIKTIGEGGMANVYLAYDTILDRNVALKVLRGDLSNDEKFVRRFQREALSASSLSHPNIVEMYDVGEDEGQYYIVMEYVDGKTLKQLIKRRGTLTINEVIDIMLQLTDGLSHAHDSYIIHRDIKPQNIMIMENGLVKITDFGIAMAINATQLTQTNSVMGSVHYLPPEQASGKGSSVKSDIYSLGILMYELLTGTIPFKGENAVEIALKQMKEPLPDVTLTNPDIPQTLENILLKATAKNPKNRYKDVRSMHEDLKTALDEERKDEKRYVYKYPENDLDDTKIMEKIEDVNKQDAQSSEVATKIEDEDKKEKNKNKLAIILSCIIIGLIIIGASIFFFITKSNNKEIKIPDVSDLTIVEAEEVLKEKGLKVKLETEKIESEEIEAGKVVKTSPAIGRSVKKGTKITLYESTGTEDIEMEDYVGQNYLEVKVKLEEILGLNVLIEKRDIEDLTDDKENIILEQNPIAGSKVAKGSTVTLYIPNMNIYPDMVEEKWTEEEVREFASEYNLQLEVSEKESSTADVGTVIWQSRRAGTAIKENVTFSVTIAKAPEEIQNPSDDQNENIIEPGEGTTNDTTNTKEDTTKSDKETNTTKDTTTNKE
ncbi:MAG: Stk1 family PASTA domain-containing Ser/Thr kinase [Bacilli bacterium]|nr:Stk1 family PASTA domain-containing Ser/Thr kinase [Bacilli bacterium]